MSILEREQLSKMVELLWERWVEIQIVGQGIFLKLNSDFLFA